MDREGKVVVITGASQGIGAALVKAYRDREYRVVATSRSIGPSNDEDVFTVPGDVADRATAERAIAERQGAVRAHRYARQQRRHLHRQAVHRIHRGRLCGNARGQSHGLLSFHAARRRRDGEAGQRPCRADHHKSRRPCEFPRPVGAGVPDEGRPQCGHQVTRDRICRARYPRERGFAGRHQLADASGRRTMRPWARFIRWGTWAKSPTSSALSSILESAPFVTGEILHVDGGQSAGH